MSRRIRIGKEAIINGIIKNIETSKKLDSTITRLIRFINEAKVPTYLWICPNLCQCGSSGKIIEGDEQSFFSLIGGDCTTCASPLLKLEINKIIAGISF